MSAEKNDIKNEMTATPKANASAFFDGLKQVDAFASWNQTDSVVERSDSQDYVYKELGVYVQRKPTGDREDGGKYYSYRIGVSTTMRGRELIQLLFLVPPHADTMIYDTLDAIFGDSETYPLEIVKTETTRDNNTTVTYTMRVSAEDDTGSEIICTLFPQGRGDRVIFQNLIGILKNRGKIN